MSVYSLLVVLSILALPSNREGLDQVLDPTRFPILHELLSQRRAFLRGFIPPANTFSRITNEVHEILTIRQPTVRQQAEEFLRGIHLEHVVQRSARGPAPRQLLVEPTRDYSLLIVKKEGNRPRAGAVVLIQLIVD
jgi:hypothetical protein